MSNKIKPLPRSAFFGAAADKVAGTPPCKDCPDRYPACAGSCEKYKAWKEKRTKVLYDCLKQEKDIIAANAVHHAGMEKALRRRGEAIKTGWR